MDKKKLQEIIEFYNNETGDAEGAQQIGNAFLHGSCSIDDLVLRHGIYLEQGTKNLEHALMKKGRFDDVVDWYNKYLSLLREECSCLPKSLKKEQIRG